MNIFIEIFSVVNRNINSARRSVSMAEYMSMAFFLFIFFELM